MRGAREEHTLSDSSSPYRMSCSFQLSMMTNLPPHCRHDVSDTEKPSWVFTDDGQDNLLEQLVGASGSPIDWEQVAGMMKNGRSSGQCAARWQKVLHPQPIKGAWTPEVRGTDNQQTRTVSCMRRPCVSLLYVRAFGMSAHALLSAVVVAL